MRLSIAFFASALLGCSSASSNATSGADAGNDSSTLDGVADSGEGNVDTAPEYKPCGAPPYFTYHLRVGEITNTGDTPPFEGATLTFDICPELAVTSDRTGEAFASVQRGVPFTAKVSAPSHVAVIAGEELVPIDDRLDEDRFIQLLPRDNAGVIPGYSTDTPSFALVIQPDPDPASPCDTINVHFVTPSGVTAHYMLATWPSDTKEIIADASGGPVVFFTGLAGTETHAFPSTTSGSESRCTLIDHSAPLHQTGKFKLSPGAWTVGDVARRLGP